MTTYELVDHTNAILKYQVYQDLASNGYGAEPYEPGNADHDEIKALVYLSGFKLVEFMPPTAQTRGDALLYLASLPNGYARLMPPGSLAIGPSYWQQVLGDILDKQLANKNPVI